MSLKIILSKQSIRMLDNCVDELEMWHFDAINAPLLLEQLVIESESCIHDYLLSEGIEEGDDTDVMIPTFIGERQEKLRIKEEKEEENKGKPQYLSEHHYDVIFKDEEGKKHKYPVSDEVFKITEKLIEICNEFKIACVRPIHIAAAMFAMDEPTLKELFTSLNANFKLAKEYFSGEEAFKIEIVPYNLSGFLTCLNDKVDPKKPCEILMRDREVEQVWNISLKKNKRNTIIVGEAGVGKSALIEKMTKPFQRFLSNWIGC